jgi:hypothetical protein
MLDFSGRQLTEESMGNDWNERRPTGTNGLGNNGPNANNSNDANAGTRPPRNEQSGAAPVSRDGQRDGQPEGQREGNREAYRDDGFDDVRGESRNDARESGRGLREPRDSAGGSDYGSAGRFTQSNRNRDISDFSLGIDSSNRNDRSQGDWFQSPYQSSSQFPSTYPQNRNEGWGSGSRGFPQNSNYSSYGATTEPSRDTYAGRGPKNYKRSEERIKEDIGHELERHPEIDASQIEVSLQDGIVTLKGHVEDRVQKRMAEDSIAYLPGVKDVRNELVIDRSLFDRARDFFMGRKQENDESEMKSSAGATKAERTEARGESRSDSKSKRGSNKRPM